MSLIVISDNDCDLINIEKEMCSSYMQYAMSTIINRALPDTYDGCKPVQRRILHVMNEGKRYHNASYCKSARVIGDVIGKYHPHGESAVYEAMARMAQDFTLRNVLIDGQGNFGSMDGDPPAAMRYTEVRMTALTYEGLLKDIDEDAVDFRENYDGEYKEPVLLPAVFPHILANGSSGVAVGMATNIPPHNLGEVIDACVAVIDNPEIDDESLASVITGPDFPTGGIIIGSAGIKQAYRTGRGMIYIRARTHFEDFGNNRKRIVVTEIPYQVNKAKMIEHIVDMINDKKIEGISEIRDESDRKGVRVVIELKKDVNEEIILNRLFIYSNMQISFGINNVALVDNKPELMSLKRILQVFIRCRMHSLTRKLAFVLNKARSRCHILIGLCVAVGNINDIIAIIRSSKDSAEAIERLTAQNWLMSDMQAISDMLREDCNVFEGHYRLTSAQAKAILEMRLQRLVNLEHVKLIEEILEIGKEIIRIQDIIADDRNITQMMKDEMLEIKNKFSTPRRTSIEERVLESNIEELVEKEDVVVAFTVGGYIKRTSLSLYKSQARGGKGRSGLDVKAEDAVSNIFITDTHAFLMFFSNKGKVYKSRVYNLPIGDLQSRGRAIVNILQLDDGEKITNIIMYSSDVADKSIVFATAKGYVRRNALELFSYIPTNGKIAMKIDDTDDVIVGVVICNEDQHIMLATAKGKCIRFSASSVRVMQSRSSVGVRGINLDAGDRVVSVAVLNEVSTGIINRMEYLRIPFDVRLRLRNADADEIRKSLDGYNIPYDEAVSLLRNEQFILTVTENGYGKRTSLYEYRATNRGGVGICNIIASSRNGKVVSSFPVYDNDEIIIMTNNGILIRIFVHDVRLTGRNTQGVTLIKLRDSKGSLDRVKSVALVSRDVIELDDGQE